MATGRSSQTMRLDSSTPRSISADEASRARSMVETSAPMWKLDGEVFEQRLERAGQNVLPGMLLHVIETPRPVDLAGDQRALRERRCQHVDDVVAVVDGVDDFGRSEPAGVERLAAGRGVEGGAIERSGRAARVIERACDSGVEPAAGGFGVIQPVRHAAIRTPRADRNRRSRRRRARAGTRYARRASR